MKKMVMASCSSQEGSKRYPTQYNQKGTNEGRRPRCYKNGGREYRYTLEQELAHTLKKWKSLSHVQLFATPWTIQSMEFSRPEYWSG